MNKKKILFVTGTRADFGKIKSVIKKIENENYFELHLFVTGMHLLKKYNYTYLEIKKENFRKVFKFKNQSEISSQNQSEIFIKTCKGLDNYIKKEKPNIIMVHGDRVESLAAATIGNLNKILVAHIEGGEVSGTIDEIYRHAITKLSNYHFVSNSIFKKRLVQLGEKKNNIFVVGSPETDYFNPNSIPNIDIVKERYDIKFQKYAICIYHPVTTISKIKIIKEISSLLKSMKSSKLNYIIIYPNNDDHSNIIINEIEKNKNNLNFKIYSSLRFEYFISLLKNSSFIIGNSSCGVREAPFFGIPTINIGDRQKNRNNSKSIINIDGKSLLISETISKIMKNKKTLKSKFFGRGKCAEKINNLLKTRIDFNMTRQKYFIDL